MAIGCEVVMTEAEIKALVDKLADIRESCATPTPTARRRSPYVLMADSAGAGYRRAGRAQAWTGPRDVNAAAAVGTG